MKVRVIKVGTPGMRAMMAARTEEKVRKDKAMLAAMIVDPDLAARERRERHGSIQF